MEIGSGLLGPGASPPETSAFRRLWAAALVSQCGSEVSLLALPLLVVLTLGGGAGQVGLIAAAGYLPWLLVALPAGALADRSRRRPLLIAADLLRAAILVVVPVAAWRGAVTVPLLVAVVLAAGSLTVVFDVAAAAYLPELVGRQRLGAANGALGTAAALAGIAGPAVGGALVGGVGAPRAVLLDAASFAVSAALVARTRPRAVVLSVVPSADTPEPRLTAGLVALWRTPPLRRLSVYTALFNGASNGMIPVLLVFLVRDAGLTPAELGLVLALATVGAIAGGMLSARVSALLGTGRAVAACAVVVAAGELLLAATPASRFAGPWVVVVMGVMWAANTAWNAQVATLRQLLSPPAILGRLTAAYRLLAYVLIPVGALTGGILGDRIGSRSALVVLAGLIAVVTLLPLGRCVRELRDPAQDEPAERDDEPLVHPEPGQSLV